MDDGDDLERILDDLAGTLDELREEVGTERRSGRVRDRRQSDDVRDDRQSNDVRDRRRTSGARDLLRFTEQYTIPAVIAILETNVRLLELLAGSIRLADGRLDEAEERRTGRTLDALDGALTDVREAVAGTPTSPEARRLLREARELRSEAERRLEERTTTTSEPGTDGSEDAVHEVPVDVEAELESIKQEVDDDAAGEGRQSTGHDAGEADDAGDGTNEGDDR